MSFDNLIEGDWVEKCDNLWEILTGTILDTRTPLERLYITVCNLKEKDLLDYRKLKRLSIEKISEIFKEAGYIWYNSKANFFNQEIDFDLETASYDDMLSIKGIGAKLATIIDTHVLKFLRSKGYKEKDYKSLSEAFKHEAEMLNLSIPELDKRILVEGIRKRRGL